MLLAPGGPTGLASLKERSLSRGAEGSIGGSWCRQGPEYPPAGRDKVGPRRSREPRRAVKAGRRPPVGEALRAWSVVVHIM